MATVQRINAMRTPVSAPPSHESYEDDHFALNDFAEELRKLAATNVELLSEFQPQDNQAATVALADPPECDSPELAFLRLENAELRSRVGELEALASGQSEELWRERQREYEMLLEEKSDVIRSLHQQIQESQECAIGGGNHPPSSVGNSGVRLGQAEEILRLKREMDEQRRQLTQDENDMMTQMRQMEMTMAKERAEMARQRQEVQRLQADLAREIENSSRDPELRERLHSLRRTQEAKPAHAPALAGANATPTGNQKSSGFFRRMFG